MTAIVSHQGRIEAIVDAGLILQIDDPRLLTYYISRPNLRVEDCRQWATLRVEALNHALRGLPEGRVRFHTCYGINIGPRVHEMSLADIVDIMLKVKAGAYLFEAGNPRHEHEWKVWEDVKLEDGKLLVPGVISHSTPLVEHPELVAQRLVPFATIVGKENVIGDCGFASFAATEQEIHPTIVCGPSLPASRRVPASPPLPCIDTRGTGSSATSQPQKDPLLH